MVMLPTKIAKRGKGLNLSSRSFPFKEKKKERERVRMFSYLHSCSCFLTIQLSLKRNTKQANNQIGLNTQIRTQTFIEGIAYPDPSLALTSGLIP